MQQQIEFSLQGPNLPTLLADETLYSWCGRFHERNGFSTVTRTSLALFEDAHAGRIHDFPGNLSRFVERTHGMVANVEALQIGHTLLGFFLPFLDHARASTLKTALCAGSFSQTKMWLGLPASRLGGELPLKKCPVCAEEDVRTHGIAYWHVAHQHPAALVCLHHGFPLQFADLNMAPVKAREWMQIRTVGAWIHGPELNDGDRHELQRVATFAAETRTLAGASLNPTEIRNRLEHRLYLAEQLTADGSVRQRQVQAAQRDRCDRMQRLYGDIPRFGVKLNLESCFEQMCSLRMRAAHPLRRVLVLSSYFTDVADLMNSTRSDVRLLAGKLARKPYPAEDRLRIAFYDQVQQGISVTAASHAVGISVTTGVQWARIAGRTFTPRPKSVSDEIQARAFDALRAGESKTSICQSLGIHVGSLNRLIGSDAVIADQWRNVRFVKERARYRLTFQTLLKEYPGVPLRQLRKIPGNGYAWLYRNDREWLAEKLPALWTRT